MILKLLMNIVKKKIEFISTPYDLESVSTLEDINVKRYKVASADIDDYLLHKRISKTKKSNYIYWNV